MSVAVTTPVPTPTSSAPARRPKLKTERLSARVSSAGLNVAVLALTLAWVTPTLGLLINSFRPSGAFNTSGWWTALAPPYQFTLDSYSHVLGASDLPSAFFNSFMITIPGTNGRLAALRQSSHQHVGTHDVANQSKRDANDHEQERRQIDRHQRRPVDLERRHPDDQA